MNCFRNGWIALMSVMGIALSVTTGWADEGHDHGEAPAATGGPALPRFTAVSELFELVGVVKGRQITLYLDRFADGSPVKDAQLELELGGVKLPVESHAEGEFEVTLSRELKPGVIAVTAAVIAGEESDLLAGALDLHDEAAVAEAHRYDWKAFLVGGVGGLAGAALLVAIARRLRASRNHVNGGAA